MIVAPVESDRILCYDLLTGESLWKGVDGKPGRLIDDGLFVACARDQTVVIVGRQAIRGLDMQSGRERWNIPLQQYGAPSGRGFLTSNDYYLPVNQPAILQIDIRNGGVVRVSETDRVLGNLVCHRDDVIAQGHDRVSVFHQAEPLRQRLAQTGNDDDDWETGCLRAQLMAHDGDLAGAAQQAAAAWQSADTWASRQLLVDLLLQWMSEDFAAARPIVNQHSELLQSEYPGRYRIARIRGLQQSGNIPELLDFLVTDAGIPPEDPFGLPGTTTTITSLRHSLRRQIMGGDESGMATDSIAAWLASRQDNLDVNQLNELRKWIGDAAFDSTVLLSIARRRKEQGDYLSAAQIIDETWRRDRDPRALVARCRMLIDTGWPAQAATIARRIADEFPDLEIEDIEGSFPASQIADRWLDTDGSPGTWDIWNEGAADARLQSGDQGEPLDYQLFLYPECVARSDHAPDDLTIMIDVDSDLVVHDSLGNEIGRVATRESDDTTRYYSSKVNSGRYMVHGHLLILGYGYDLVGVDLHRLRAGDRSPLWHRTLHHQSGNRETMLLQSGISVRANDNPWGVQRIQLAGRDGDLIGVFAASSRFVYYIIDNRLHCIDALSGEPQWQRADIPDDTWLHADLRHVYLLTPPDSGARAGRYESIQILDAEFGDVQSTVMLPDPRGPVLWHCLDQIAVFTSSVGGDQILKGIEMRTGDTAWEYRCERGSLGCLRDPQSMLVYRTDGKLQYIDMHNGQVTAEMELPAVGGKMMQVQRLRDHDLVLVGTDHNVSTARSSRTNRTIRATSVPDGLFDGSVFCIDRQVNQMCWPAPVRIEHFSMPGRQPADVPLMTVSRIVSYNSNRRGAVIPEFFTIDLRDGRLLNVYRQRRLSVRSYEFRGIPDEQSVELSFGDQKLVIRLDSGPLPPSAPAQLVDEFTMIHAGQVGEGFPSAGNDPATRRQELLEKLMPAKPAKENNHPDNKKP